MLAMAGDEGLEPSYLDLEASVLAAGRISRKLMAELTGVEPVPADRQSAILPIDHGSGSLPWTRTTISAFRAQRPTIGRRGNFEIVKELVAGERFERPYPDSKSRVLPLDDPASHRKLVTHDGIESPFPVGKTGGLPLAECAQKHESPRFLSEAQKITRC